MTCRMHFLVTTLMEEVDDDKYSDWERKFVEDLAIRLENGGVPTERQEEKLEEIWKK